MPSRRSVLATAGALAGAAAVPAQADAGTRVAHAAAQSDSSADAPSVTWERTYAPADEGRALVRDVVPVGGDLALVGVASDPYRGWVGRVDAAGRARWHRLFGPTRGAFLAGAPAAGGEGVVAGGVANVPASPTGEDHSDPYLLRATGGDVDWARTYQPDAPDGRADALVPVGDGYVLAGGVAAGGTSYPWAAGVDADGTRTWSWRGESAGDVNGAVAVPGGLVVGGSTWPAGADVPEPRGRQEAAWLAKLGADGEVAWRWSVDRERGDRVEALAARPGGGVVAVGRRGFASDDEGVGWLVALDADGARAWERTYPREGWDWHHDVAPAGDGYALVGTLADADSDDRGAWLLRVDADGRPAWEHRAEPGTRGYAVASRPDGGLVVGGSKDLDAPDAAEGWLAKLGGDPPASGGPGAGWELPGLPGWAGPLVAGGALGALGTRAVARWRR